MVNGATKAKEEAPSQGCDVIRVATGETAITRANDQVAWEQAGHTGTQDSGAEFGVSHCFVVQSPWKCMSYTPLQTHITRAKGRQKS